MSVEDTVTIFIPGEVIERLAGREILDERMQRELARKAREAQGWSASEPLEFGYIIDYALDETGRVAHPLTIRGVRYLVTRPRRR